MNTILVVTSDDALRARLMVGLGDHSVFTAANDAEALKTLRLIEIDVVVRGGAGMPRDVGAFVTRVRAIAPSALTVAISATAEDAEAADFTLAPTLTQRELEVLRWLQTELSGPEIADALVIALSTVRTHTKSIYAKLNVHSKKELAEALSS